MRRNAEKRGCRRGMLHEWVQGSGGDWVRVLPGEEREWAVGWGGSGGGGGGGRLGVSVATVKPQLKHNCESFRWPNKTSR